METTHYTKSSLQGSVPELMNTTYMTCWIATETRGIAEYAAWGEPAQVLHAFECP